MIETQTIIISLIIIFTISALIIKKEIKISSYTPPPEYVESEEEGNRVVLFFCSNCNNKIKILKKYTSPKAIKEKHPCTNCNGIPKKYTIQQN